jgi:hypothetical protein
MCTQTGFGTGVAVIGFAFLIDPGVAYAQIEGATSTSVNRRRCLTPGRWHPNRREPSAGGSV